MVANEVLFTMFATSFMLALVPGPDNIFLLTQSALEGRVAGLSLTFGLLTGLLCHTIAVALGVSVILKTSIVAFTILKILGVSYLLYLAWGAFRVSATKISANNRKKLGNLALYRRGILMNVINPKISIFYLAFLPQFIDPSTGNTTRQIFELSLSFIAATLVVFTAIAYLSGMLGDFLKKSNTAQNILNKVAGIVFIGLALRLAIASNQ